MSYHIRQHASNTTIKAYQACHHPRIDQGPKQEARSLRAREEIDFGRSVDREGCPSGNELLAVRVKG